MGWFSWIRKKVIEPVVEAVVEPIVEAVVEPIVTHVIEPVVTAVTDFVDTVNETVITPIVDYAVAAFETAKDYVVTEVTKLAFDVVDGITNAAFQKVIEIWNNAVDRVGPTIETDFAQFAPVGETVQHTTISTNDISAEVEVELRDAIVSSQVGHADYDVFLAAGAIDADGYVLDEALFYETADWYVPLEDWAAARFDVVRVLEAESDFFIPTFEANVALMHNVVTDIYFISVGGTQGIADIITDINLVVAGDTGDSADAISGLIESFYLDGDIPADASVVLSGMSLGGAEVLQQYRLDPDAYDHVYAITSAGLGGIEGTYYDNEVWDGMGDENITEINGDDPGYDFNDLVTSLGHIGAGQTYFIDEIIQAPGDIPIQAQIEAGDSHNLGNIFASLPSGATPDIPLTDMGEDAFLFV